MLAASSESAIPKMPHSSRKPSRSSISSDVNASGKRFMPRRPGPAWSGPSGYPIGEDAGLFRGAPDVGRDLHHERDLDRVRSGRKDPASQVHPDLFSRLVQEANHDLDPMRL